MKQVFSAWTPLEASVRRDRAEIKVWNREAVFTDGLFPSSLTSGKTELLSRPITLTGSYAGQTVSSLSGRSFFPLEITDEKAAFQLSAKMGNTVINALITAEFDGLIDLRFSVIPFWSFSPDGGAIPLLDRLWVDVPVKKEFARLYHYWPNDLTSIIPSQTVVNADALPEEGLSLPFKPYLWLGDEERGVGVSMESDENIEVSGAQSEFIVREDEVILRLHLLDHMPAAWLGTKDQWVSALNPIEYRIGLMVTPTKPVDKKDAASWRALHVFGNMYKEEADGSLADCGYVNEVPGALQYLAEMGVKWLIFHESSSRAQDWGLIENPERFRAMIDACHEKGIKTMMYFGYELSTLSPVWYDKARDYLINTPDGHYTGGWQRLPHQRAFMVCYRGGYGNELIRRVEYVMDTYGIDGIYTDGTYVPWECANPRHGCGYTDAKGVRHTTFPLFAVRETVKNLYEAVHKRGGRIDTHQSTCCIAPTLSFCDSYYDGENIQSSLIKALRSDSGITSFMSLPAFRTEYMGKNLGLIPQFIAYSNPTLGWTMEKTCALTLPHDVLPRPRQTGDMSMDTLTQDLSYVSQIWKVFDEFDTLSCEFLPYWKENALAKNKTEGAYLSLYKGKRTLGVLSNLTSRPLTAEIETAASEAVNVLTGEAYPAENGVIRVPTQSCIPILLELK